MKLNPGERTEAKAPLDCKFEQSRVNKIFRFNRNVFM